MGTKSLEFYYTTRKFTVTPLQADDYTVSKFYSNWDHGFWTSNRVGTEFTNTRLMTFPMIPFLFKWGLRRSLHTEIVFSTVKYIRLQ